MRHLHSVADFRDVPKSAKSDSTARSSVLASVASKVLGDLSRDKVMTREAQVKYGGKTIYVRESLMDSGASDGNYAGEAIADRFDNIEREPCCHQVRQL